MHDKPTSRILYMILFVVLPVFPLWGLELFVVPMAVWVLAAPRWHTPLAIAYATAGGIALMLSAHWLFRLLTRMRLSPGAQAEWRWSRRTPPENFRVQIANFLRLCGWHVVSSAIGGGGRVELIVRKDRWCVGLICIGPEQDAAGADDVLRLGTMRCEPPASHRAIVTTAAFNPEVQASVDQANVIRLRFNDLQRLEEAIGLKRLG